MSQRTAQVNQLRAFLLERGMTMPNGVAALRRRLPEVLEDADNDLSDRLRALVAQLWQQVSELEAHIATLNAAMVATVGDGKQFRCGRELATFLGLVPRLLGISKRGNTYLRMLLIHGARAVLRGADQRSDRLGPWLRELKERRPSNVTAVALANKLARIAWVVLVHGEGNQPSLGLVESS